MAGNIILMEDMIIYARNVIVSSLATATGLPIALSDEQNPEAKSPYGYYSIITPYVPTGEIGSHIQQTLTNPDTGEKRIKDIRYEHPEMLLSFNFCSNNHMLDNGTWVNGETEAMHFAMKAVAWLKHTGATELSGKGLVVLRVSNCSSRSGLVADEYVRRWGFDVAIRYKAMTVRNDEIIENVLTIRK